MSSVQLSGVVVEFARVAVLVPVSLLPILNPLGNVPLFLTLLGGADDRIVRKVARHAAVNCFFLLIAATLFGAYVLGFFGVSLPVVRVGGGLLVAAAGWRLLDDAGPDTVQSNIQAAFNRGLDEEELRVRSFYPISFPLTVGPGSISASITIGTGTPAHALDWLVAVAGVTVGVTVTAAVIYLCYRYSGRLMRALGPLGASVLRRLSAFILLCIGVEIVWDGIEGLLAGAAFMHAPSVRAG